MGGARKRWAGHVGWEPGSGIPGPTLWVPCPPMGSSLGSVQLPSVWAGDGFSFLVRPRMPKLEVRPLAPGHQCVGPAGEPYVQPFHLLP
jgi:hypothetical protein